MSKALLLLVCASLVLLVSASARAATGESPTFATASALLQRGAFEDAIDQFEALADQGFVHPDASFNRASAYVLRARSPQARPGDLGQAAAGFNEALLLRPGDDQAEQALERVRSEIARRRAREGGEPVAVSQSLSRAVVGLLTEGTWSILAAFGSLLLTIGMSLYLFGRRSHLRLSGAVAAPIGALLLIVCGGLALAAGHYHRTSRPAVVVVAEARLIDEYGVPIKQVNGVPEHITMPAGAGVYILERRGPRSHIEWGPTQAWVLSSQIRPLARP